MQRFDPERIVRQFTASVPRYTSYPTAPHFAPDLGQTMLPEALAGIGSNERISVYVHIPFCDRLCWFCGCHTKHTLKYEPVRTYVSTLVQELRLVSKAIGFKPLTGHVHLGGGSPSILKTDDFSRLGQELRSAFAIDEKTEISVEIDPSDVTIETLSGLTELGITRASIGVQDFDEEVQKAINRPQTFEQTRDVTCALRSIGVRSLNIDALYGLPLQTLPRVAATIEKVVSLSPDRAALFGYAHVPWLKKHQTMIRDEDLPHGIERFRQSQLAGRMLRDAGYQPIGIDHFAKPDDMLAVAARTGHLRRNFQGYTTDSCETLVGIGASSIGSFREGYVQNIVPTAQFAAVVGQGKLTGMRGYRKTQDDHIRGWIIERLMCDFAVSLSELACRYGAAAEPYVRELVDDAKADTQGLCAVDSDWFSICDEARPFARIVASRFDAYLPKSMFRYSKAV